MRLNTLSKLAKVNHFIADLFRFIDGGAPAPLTTQKKNRDIAFQLFEMPTSSTI